MNKKDYQELESLRNAACCIAKRSYVIATYGRNVIGDQSETDLGGRKSLDRNTTTNLGHSVFCNLLQSLYGFV